VFNPLSWESLLEFAQEAIGFYKMDETDITAWEVISGLVMWAISMIL